MVFISCTYVLVIHGELDKMLTPRLLILQLHFQLRYLIFTGPQAPNSLVMKTSFQRTWAKKLPKNKNKFTAIGMYVLLQANGYVNY